MSESTGMGPDDSSSQSSGPDSLFESLLRRDRVFVWLGLVGATAVAWIYLAQVPHGHHHGSSFGWPHEGTGSLQNLALLFVMWTIMMVAMMLPTAAPMILTYAGIARRRRVRDGPGVSVLVLVLGYLAVWTGFSLAAAVLDWELQRMTWVNAEGRSESLLLSAALLIAAGLFQWTPLKTACLSRCRSPLALMLTEWREGVRGAWLMGLRHGLFCLGCCWALMGLMWLAGMLNLLWLAALTLYMLAEKVVPGGERFARWTGGGLVAAGLALVAWVVAGPVVS